jgi:FixJ family two-component response regulator
MDGILVLDDDADVRDSMELALQEAGAGYVLAAARFRDLEASGVLDCSCAVLDVNLGPNEPTGIDAARWLRNQGFTGRILFLTGHAGAYPSIRQTCDELNASLIEKPADIDRLLDVISA